MIPSASIKIDKADGLVIVSVKFNVASVFFSMWSDPDIMCRASASVIMVIRYLDYKESSHWQDDR